MKTNLNVDTQALREKILDLAMRGKLVKQDAGDEPASVLLEKIKAEKAELVKEGKIKKSKKLPEITEDEKPFDIPDSWEWVRLGDVSSIHNGDRGKNYPGKKYWIEEGIPFVNAGALGNSMIVDHQQLNYISEDRYKMLRAGFINKGDIFFCIRGSLGKCAISDIEIGAIASSLAIIRVILLSTEYVYFALRSSLGQMFINEHRNGSAQPNIPGKDLYNFLIPLPPLAEQKRIADKVSELFKQVDIIEKNVAEYQDLEQAMRSKLLDLAMRGKLVEQDPSDEPASELLKKIQAEKAELVRVGKIKKSKKLPEITDDEKPFDIPDSWEWVRLGELLIPEVSKSPTEDFVYLDIASINNKINKIIDPKTINIKKEKVPSRARMVVESGDILFSLVRPYLRNIAMVPKSSSNLVASTGFYVMKPYKMVNFKYLFYTMLSDYVVTGLTDRYMKGDNSPSIKKGDLQSYVVPLPPLAEQKRIADKLTRLFEDLDTIKQNLATVS